MKQNIIALLLAFSIYSHAQTGEIQRVEPESVGIPAKTISNLADSLMALPETNIHSLIVMRNGKIAGEMYPKPFSAECQHIIYSCSKTFLSAGIGIAIGEGKLKLNSRVADFFPMKHPNQSNFNAMTVRHLLTMASGIEPDWDFRNNVDNWTETYLKKKIDKPGKNFKYDSMASYMLSAILQKATGKSTFQYVNEHIFQPLGITEVAWEESPEGINTGGWGVHIQPESMAKFGQLLLQKGEWNGKQLIPEKWVKGMMKKQIDTGGRGYGYHIWLSEAEGTFCADGAYGQYIFIVPKHDLVVVVTQWSTYDGGKERNMILRNLLPAIVNSSLPTADNTAYHKHMQSMTLPPPAGKPINKLISATINLDTNNWGWTEVSFEGKTDGKLIFSYTQEGKRVTLPMEYNNWTTITTPVHPIYTVMARNRFAGLKQEYTVAGSYAIDNEGNLHVRLHYTNWITPADIIIANPFTNNPSVKLTQNFSR